MMNYAVETFERHRPLLFSIAYRMLGSAMQAEDLVQESFLRYQGYPPDQIEDSKAFLTTVVTRLSLNELSRARQTRESYIGPWLPEPVITENNSSLSPSGRMIERETISMAFLVLLERLSPEERAVFLLREVFQYPYEQIAEMLKKSEAACRQHLSRAKTHIAANRPRFSASETEHNQVFQAFIGAIGSGDLTKLETLLAEDVGLVADGGGRIRGAATRPITGRADVAAFLLNSMRFAPGALAPEVAEINGQPAILLRADGQPFIVVMLDVVEGEIQMVRLLGNPDKLQALS